MRSLGCVISLVCIFTLCSCEVKMPDYVIPPAEMETFLYDYHLVQSMSGQYSSDDYKEKLYYGYVFRKHNVEKSRFDSSMQWYNRNPKHLRRIYESLEARLNTEVDRLNEEKNLLQEGVSLEDVSLAKDSVDLWTSSKFKYLSSTPLNSRLAFSFKAPEDTSFVKNDSLSFSFSAYFLSVGKDSVRQNAYASIRLDYAGGEAFTNAVRIDSAGSYNLSAVCTPDSRLKSMSGFIYYADDDSLVNSGLLLSDITLVRIRPQKPKKDN